MKFLCLECDAQMKSVESERQSGDGTLSVVLECPECFSQFGLLTNPMETRMLDALDVSVCPVGGRGRADSREGADEPAARPAQPHPTATAGKCPFPGVSSTSDANRAGSDGRGPSDGRRGNAASREGANEEGRPDDVRGNRLVPPVINWSPEALARLEHVPSFARSMVKRGIEDVARGTGQMTVTEGVMDDARERMGF